MAEFLLLEDGSQLLQEDGSGLELDVRPSFVSVGTVASGTGNISPGLPAGRAVGDDMYLFVETQGGDAVSRPTNLWRQLGHVQNGPSTRISCFTKRVTASEPTVTVSDPGDHAIGVILCIRDGHGWPHLTVTDLGTETGTNQVQVIEGGTTTEDNCLIIIATSNDIDIVSSTSYDGWTNPDLTNVTERVDSNTSNGNGGGLGIATGELNTAGSFGPTTVTNALTNPAWTAMTLAIRPTWAPNDNFADAEVITVPDPLLPVPQTYYGSSFDANNETGEDLTATGNFSTLDRTEWWSYTADVRRIVKMRMIDQVDPEGFFSGAFMIFRRLPAGGTGADDVVEYAIVPTGFSPPETASFGEDEGRGAHFAYYLAESTFQSYTRLQIEPADTLYIQAGRNSVVYDAEYSIIFETFRPPSNDNIADAFTIDEFTDDSFPFDLMGATGEPGLRATLPDFTAFVTQGDIFFTVTPTSDKILHLNLEKLDITHNARDQFLFVFQGNSFDSFTYVTQITGAFSGDDPRPIELPLTAGTPYTIVLIISQYQLTPGTVVTDGILSWSWPSSPANDNFADAELLTGDSGSTSVVDTTGATVETGERPTFVGKTIWFEFTPPTGGWYLFECDSFPATGTYIASYRGTSLADLELAQQVFEFNGGVDPRFALALRGGDTFFIQLAPFGLTPWDYGTMSWSLMSSTQDTNDDFANARIISGASGSDASTMEGSTNEAGELSSTYNTPPGETLWWQWTAPSTGWFTFWTDTLGDATPPDSAFAIWHGTPGLTSKVAANLNGRLDGQQQIAFHATSGETYYIETDSFLETIVSWDAPFAFNLLWDTFPAPTNDVFAGAIEFMAGGGAGQSDTFDTFGHSTTEVTQPDIATLWLSEWGTDDNGDPQTVIARPAWFKLTPDRTGTYTFSIEGTSALSGTFTLLEGTSQATLEYLQANDDSDWAGDNGEATALVFANDGPANVSVDLVAGGSYYALVTGFLYDNAHTASQTAATQNFPDVFSNAEVPQFEFNLSWVFEPAKNDDIQSQDDQEFSENQGNLNYWFPYHYTNIFLDQGEDPSFTISALEGGCRRANNFGATAQPGEPSHAGGFPATRSLWFSFTPYRGGDYKFTVEPTGLGPVTDPLMAIYDWAGTIGGLSPALASDDDTNGLFPEITITLTQFDTYLIAVDARDEGEFLLNWEFQPTDPPPVNDDFADAITITPGTPLAGTTVGATMECGETPVAGSQTSGTGGSVWYSFVAAETTVGIASLTTDNTTIEYLFVDIFEGTSLDNLVNITDGSNYWLGSANDTVNVPFPITAGQTYYIRVTHSYLNGGTAEHDFSVEMLQQSTTPPTNDDSEDATDVPGSTDSGTDITSPGTTDGSTYQPGEVDPAGGLLEDNSPGGGTTWHKYVAQADGFIAAWVERPGVATSDWYRIGVWEGTTRESSRFVGRIRSPRVGGAQQTYYEVRAGQTYLIQVIRENQQTWGDYNLIINEYLETVDWELGPDSFTTEHGGVDITGGTMTCSGRGFADARDFVQQYGTLDMESRKWSRGLQVHFEVRIVGGQILYRNGTDDTDFTTLASDDHAGLGLRTVGLLRARDFDGTQQFVLSLRAESNGQNTIELQGRGIGDPFIRPYPISLGAGGHQHDTGWVSVLVCVDPAYGQHADGTDPSDGQVKLHVYIDGRAAFHYTNTENLYAIYVGKAIRYLDIGMWRHPGSTVADDVEWEDPEIWTYEMRNIKVTNMNRKQHLDVEVKGDYGITEFDGFKPRVVWNQDRVIWGFTAHHGYNVAFGSFEVTDFPDKDWGAFETFNHGTTYGDQRPRYVVYPQHIGSQRWYGFSFNSAQMPTAAFNTTLQIAGYEFQLASFKVTNSGELRLRIYQREFCVAHLQTDHHYFIEVHCNFETMWGASCEVFINGQSFGTFSEAYTWAEIGEGNFVTTAAPAAHYTYVDWYAGNPTSSREFVQWDFFFTNLVTGRATLEDPVGPFECITVAGVESTGAYHHIPEWPASDADRMPLYAEDAPNDYATLYDWQFEWDDAGPYTLTKPSDGHDRLYPFPDVTRNYHPFYELSPTSCWLEENAGSGNNWSPINEGRTRNFDSNPITATGGTKILKMTHFGESVPVTDTFTILGIEVTVRRQGAGVSDSLVQLYKGGTLTGSDMSGGGWSSTWETVTYGGPTELWGTAWTPDDVNDDGFGIGIQASGGTAEIDGVEIKVYFDDAGYGGQNRWGEQLVGEFYATGDPATSMDAWGFSQSGEPGGTRGPRRTLSGVLQQLWGSFFPWWGFFLSSKGSVDWYDGVGGESAVVQDYRAVRDPLTFPRHAWSNDNGATYTRVIDPDEVDSAVISGDVGDGNTSDTIFVDNVAALDRFEHNREHPASRAYRFRYWHLSYLSEDTPGEFIAANFYIKYRPYSGYPTTAAAGGVAFASYVAGADGTIQRVASYGGTGIVRHTVPRDPGGTPWTEDAFNEMTLRLGFNAQHSIGTFSVQNSQANGGAIYAATWELLVVAEPDEPPAGCFDLIPMNWRSGNRYPVEARVLRGD